jgi:hypothetical protein
LNHHSLTIKIQSMEQRNDILEKGQTATKTQEGILGDMAQTIKAAKAENDPRILTQVRAFLKALNSGDGKPIEQLSPVDARAVLVNAQKSVVVDYSGIEESERTITQDGQTVKIHIVKPTGARTESPVLHFYPRRRLGTGRLSYT